MQLDFFSHRPNPQDTDLLIAGAKVVPVRYRRNPRARRYVLRVREDGSAIVTIPRGGSQAAADAFARRHAAWVEKQLFKQASQSALPKTWSHGTEIFFRGEPVQLIVAADARQVQFAGQCVALAKTGGDVRPAVERHLWSLAVQTLVPRVWELAARHALRVGRVTVRNQRSRWGSCSVKGTISLNWRLIQTPDSVRDYIILHELMHLREMNHSRRFWRLVAEVCPEYAEAEKWLDRHASLLR